MAQKNWLVDVDHHQLDDQKMENVRCIRDAPHEPEEAVIHDAGRKPSHLLTTSENDDWHHNSPDMFQPCGEHRIYDWMRFVLESVENEVHCVRQDKGP